MAEIKSFIITCASIINRCNKDGKLHLFFTEAERPCQEAYLKELRDTEGNLCSRYFIDIENTVDAVDALGDKYNLDVLVSPNDDFPQYISLVLYDEEVDQKAYD